MKKTQAQIIAENRQVASLPGSSGEAVVEILKGIRGSMAAIRRTMDLSAQIDAAHDYNRLLTDAEKQQLTGCPYCGTDYAHGCSEVDADNIARVTCGFCERAVEYRIEFIKKEMNNGI